MISGMVVGFLIWVSYLFMVVLSLKRYERIIPGMVFIVALVFVGCGASIGYLFS